MEELEQVEPLVTQELAARAFAGMGCEDHGIVVMKGAKSWGAHERGYIELPTVSGTLMLRIAYDERGGPYVVDEAGREMKNLLISLTDDKDYLACAWARVNERSRLVGVGIDLTNIERFAKPRSSKHDLVKLLFTEQERSLAPLIVSDNPHFAHAALFATKEAGFKATAAPLRRWYDSHDQELLFEVRHFVTEEPGFARGTGRNAAAQEAMDAMGIDRIVVHHSEVCDRALTVAIALTAGGVRA